MLEEKISKNLGVPYIYLPDKRKFLCSNGVLFTMEEYKAGIDIKAEYEKRKKDDTLFDYTYAKNTGLLRKKTKLNNDNTEKKQDLKTDNTVIKTEKVTVKAEKSDKSVLVICLLLFFTSLVSMYISPLHTATYLFDYVDVFSAWLMSASVTAYNSTAFEVSVLFHTKKRTFRGQ